MKTVMKHTPTYVYCGFYKELFMYTTVAIIRFCASIPLCTEYINTNTSNLGWVACEIYNYHLLCHAILLCSQ